MTSVIGNPDGPLVRSDGAFCVPIGGLTASLQFWSPYPCPQHRQRQFIDLAQIKCMMLFSAPVDHRQLNRRCRRQDAAIGIRSSCRTAVSDVKGPDNRIMVAATD